jgi:hypothetical protein
VCCSWRDAEFILIEAFYRRLYGRAPEEDGVHIIAIGGTSFRRYLELARLLENRVAAFVIMTATISKTAMNAMLT